MTTWRRAALLIAAVCDLVAGGVIALWAVSGAFVLSPFALLFVAAGVVLMAALSRNSTRLVVLALGMTVAAEIAPLGGVTASVLLRAPTPWLGSVVPLCAGGLAIAGVAAALGLWRTKAETSRPR